MQNNGFHQLPALALFFYLEHGRAFEMFCGVDGTGRMPCSAHQPLLSFNGLDGGDVLRHLQGAQVGAAITADRKVSDEDEFVAHGYPEVLGIFLARLQIRHQPLHDMNAGRGMAVRNLTADDGLCTGKNALCTL